MDKKICSICAKYFCLFDEPMWHKFILCQIAIIVNLCVSICVAFNFCLTSCYWSFNSAFICLFAMLHWLSKGNMYNICIYVIFSEILGPVEVPCDQYKS